MEPQTLASSWSPFQACTSSSSSSFRNVCQIIQPAPLTPSQWPSAVVNITLLPPAGFRPYMLHPMGPPPPVTKAPGPIHYSSQDPQRMGAHAGKHSCP
ncbi:unnamed protein product [Pipistrellus nathusii]|uniref:Uncharacterized protein n=1 Tax=Pipistrellus nathusii TaxID=59473 RepID=A0ABP0AB33_PIPNA